MTATLLASVSRAISGAAVEWRCDPDSVRQRIYYANHSSHLDFVVIWSSLPAKQRRLARPVAGRDYWADGPIRRYLASEVFNAVLVDRGGHGPDDAVSSARRAIERMAEEMGDRHSLIVFPEGTRSLTGDVGAFKSGLYHLSRLRPDAELIPVHLENLNRILPKGEMLPVPMLSRVTFGAPLRTAVDEGKAEFLGRARTALIAMGAS